MQTTDKRRKMEPEAVPIVHVYPLSDEENHELDGFGCPCSPEIKSEDGGVVVVHHKAS